MPTPRQTNKKHNPSLADLLTEEQEAKLALLLAQVMAHGRGTLEIVIMKGKVRFFIPKPSIEAQTEPINY
jgi:hypothetical protein